MSPRYSKKPKLTDSETTSCEKKNRVRFQEVRRHGGIPYVVAFQELPLPMVFRSEADGRTIYFVE